MSRGTHIQGLRSLMKKLHRLEAKGARRALRKAMNAGTTELAKAVKASTPVDEGVLKKMQDRKVTGRGPSLVGVVGANAEKLVAASEADGDANRPSNIDWLVQNGHVTPAGTFVPPTGFMDQAAATGLPKAESRFVAKLREEIEREVLR